MSYALGLRNHWCHIQETRVEFGDGEYIVDYMFHVRCANCYCLGSVQGRLDESRPLVWCGVLTLLIIFLGIGGRDGIRALHYGAERVSHLMARCVQKVFQVLFALQGAVHAHLLNTFGPLLLYDWALEVSACITDHHA